MLTPLLILIFSRPLICSLAFPLPDLIYSIILSLFLIVWLLHRKIPSEEIQGLQFALIAFILVLFTSTIFSIDWVISAQKLYRYTTCLLSIFFALSLNPEERERVIKTMVLSAIVISLFAIYQYLFGFKHIEELIKDKTVSAFTLEYIQRRRIYFPFVTPNILGGYLAMTLPLALVFWNNKNKKDFFCFLPLIIMLSLALFFTKSLGALLSLCVGVIIYFYLQLQINKKWLLFTAGILIIFMLVFMLRQITAKNEALPSYSLAARLGYWKESLEIIKAVKWHGVGLGKFNLVASRYAHNSFLQIWAEMGLLGIISILWLIISVLRNAFEGLLRGVKNRNILIGLIAANAVFLTHNLVDFSFFLPEVALLWWIILGLIIN